MIDRNKISPSVLGINANLNKCALSDAPNNAQAIADRAQRVAGSLTLVISARAKKMQEEGIKVISFTVGEPDFNTPNYILDAAKKALDEGKTKYVATSGILPLRKAICEKLKKDNGLNYAPNQIVVANGAKQAIFNATQALINPGDEVIIPAPYWVTYPELVKLAGGVPVIIETKQSEAFKLTPSALKAAITPNTKAVILNSPNNPTGTVYSEAELRALAAIIEKAGIWVISDEIYENLIYGDKKHWSIAGYSEAVYNRTVLINGMSKTYSMTGWRIGYSACNAELAAAIENMQSHMTGNVNSITQYAALEALSGEGGDFLKKMVGEFDKRRRYMLERLAKMPHITFPVPEGAFYVMVNINKLKEKIVKSGKFPNAGTKIGAHEIAAMLLEQAKIAVVPGDAFGAPDYIRLCYTLSLNDIQNGLDALEQFLKVLG